MVIHAWNPNTLEVGVGGSRVLCQLGLDKPSGLPGTYSCIYWGHTVLVLLFEHAISHTSSQVEDLFWCDGPLGGDWLLRVIFMNGFMCWCVIISKHCWEMLEVPEVDVKIHSSGCTLFSPAVVLFNFLLGMKWETPPYIPTALTFCCNIGQKCGTKWTLWKTMGQNTCFIFYVCFLQIFWSQAYQSNRYIWSQKKEKRQRGVSGHINKNT